MMYIKSLEIDPKDTNSASEKTPTGIGDVLQDPKRQIVMAYSGTAGA